MKLSERTLQVLKNFSAMNQSILVKPGSALETISSAKKVIARAEVPETFDRTFAIYDLARFLGAMSLFKDPDVEIGDKAAVIASGGRRLTYVFASPETVLAPPAKGVKFPSDDEAPVVEFVLTDEVRNDVRKAVSVLGAPEIAIVGSGGKLTIRSSNSKDKTAHAFSVDLGETDEEFVLVFKAETLAFMPASYDARLSLKGIAHFRSDSGNEYFVVAEDA